MMNSSSSFKPPLKLTSKRLIRTKWRMMRNSQYSQKTSKSCQHSWWIRLTFRNTLQSRRVHVLLRTLPPWSRLTRGLHQWKGGHFTNIGGMWTLKHGISSTKFYDILIKTELKGDTSLNLKNFFNHIKMSLNAVTRLIEDLLPDYQSIKSTLSLKNNLSHIAITLPTPGMSMYTLPLDTHS